MQLLDNGVGWAAGRNNLLRTADAGLHWTEITPSGKAGRGIDSVFFLNANQGWVITSDPGSASTGVDQLVLSSTVDAGANWTARPLPVSYQEGGVPMAIDFVDADHGWVMLRMPSSSNFSRGELLATTDGGRSWSTLPTPPSGQIMNFVSATTGWLTAGAEREQLYITRDGGQHWQRQQVAAIPADTKARGPSYSLPTFTNARNGTLSALYDVPGKSLLTLYATGNGGLSWTTTTSLSVERDAELERTALASVVAADTAFLLSGSQERISVLQPGQQRYSKQRANPLEPGEVIASMQFKDNQRGWLLTARGHCAGQKSNCGQEQRLFATDDGASSLREITPQVSSDVAAAVVDAKLVVNSIGKKGFDKCAAGSVSQMQAWWTNTPWSDVNIYIGGSNRGCAQANLTAGWVTSILNQGWRLMPTWVGPQAPGSVCSGCGKMSSNTATARQQGINEANAATDAAARLGLRPPTVIYYDMERYDPTSNLAVRAFVDGWTLRMHQRGNKAGVYGAAVNAARDWAAIANPPDAVWIAAWDGRASVFGISGLPDGLWTTHQRIHQYRGDHNETWGGVTFNIDSNYEDGPVADR